MMRQLILAAFGATLTIGNFSIAADPDTLVYEMRVYYAAEGKLDALNARFRDHTSKLFEKHGITNIGYFTPLENPDRQLIYFLAFPNRDAAKKSWADFGADPDWQKARKASEVDGRLVTKVESKYLQATDYSPAINADAAGNRVFELRTYTATPGNLKALHARFRDHTVKLFEKHGMTNVGYWSPTSDVEGADVTLIYLLAHKSQDAAKASFDAFRSDADWTTARAASEQKAGGSLTVPNGVKSVFLQATDYSPLR